MDAGRVIKRATWLAALLVLLPAGAWAEGLGKNKDLESNQTTYTTQYSNEGIGADQLDAVTHAKDLLMQGKQDEADREFDSILVRFSKLMSAGDRVYVSFRSDADYQQYLDGLKPDLRKRVVRVHVAFPEALQMKAYIASSQRQWDQAMAYLEKKANFAPYEAQTYLEMGYILNSQGKPQEALDTYRKAYALGQAHHAAPQELAAALRGTGSALIDLNKLDDAEAAFNKSLEIDPGNQIAQGELEYIRKMRAQHR